MRIILNTRRFVWSDRTALFPKRPHGVVDEFTGCEDGIGPIDQSQRERILRLEKRQADLISRLFSDRERIGVNATRLVTKAFQLHILDLNNLEPDEE
mgnify:CR=1 FL=1